MNSPLIVEFPLRGEWLSPNTPGTKIPSHGTNKFATRYAYDFIQVDWKRKGFPAYQGSVLQYILCGKSLRKYYCWGQPVFAPCDGIVVDVKDGYPERFRTNVFCDLLRAYRSAKFFSPQNDSIQTIAGNYVIIQFSKNLYAALVHMQTGSIKVSIGESVKKGQQIGNVGHSGNSFAPHLHFQVMDNVDISKANGVLCAFEKYEIFENGQWRLVERGIPTNKDRIRFLDVFE